MRTKEILAQRNETVYLLDNKTVPLCEKSNLTTHLLMREC